MKSRQTLILILLTLSVVSCNEKSSVNNPAISINIADNVSNMQVKNLSSFTDNITYIPLQTTREANIPFLYNLYIPDSIMLVVGLSDILLFTTSGDFIRKIGNEGRGPGEYKYITGVNLVVPNKIYISDLYDLYEYNVYGKFIKKYSNLFRPTDKYYIGSCYFFNDSVIFGQLPNMTGQYEYKSILLNKNSNVIKYYKNYILFNRTKLVSSGFENASHIYPFNGEYFYKDYYNDTLFCIDEKYNLVPRYIFDLGKYKEPLSEREKLVGNDIMRYIYLHHVFQTEKYLFLECPFGNHFPAKRLTPITLYGNVSWLNTTYMLGIFDKETKELAFCKPTNTNNNLFTTGICNDIDAGPRFFPHKMINDSTLVMYLGARRLKEHIASDDFKNGIAKYPEKKKQLEELAGSLTEFDNPVLMFVTFKSK